MEENDKPLEDQAPSSAPSEGDSPEGQPKGRTAEDRINELLSKNKELQERLEGVEGKTHELETKFVPTPPPSKSTKSEDPDVEKAIRYLKENGKFVDEEGLEKRLQAIKDRMVADNEHQRLESNFSGADGRPKYDRAKIEDHSRKTGIWNFEAAYNDLYRDELLDFEIKKVESDRKKKPYVVRPNSTQGSQEEENTITREKISEWLKTPEGRAKYEQNRDKILKLMATSKL